LLRPCSVVDTTLRAVLAVTAADSGCYAESMNTPRRLPVVEYKDKCWFFDERLRQIRNVENPHDYEDLDDFRLRYFRERRKRSA